jgi:ABC-2 type transport system permease protein
VTAATLASPAGTPVRGPAAALHDVWVLTGRYLRGALSTRSIVTMVAFPLVYFVGFSVVLHRLLQAQGLDSAQFLPSGVVVQAVLSSAMNTAYVLAQDRGSGMLARCRSLPINGGALVTARLAAEAVRALAAFLVVVLAGALVGFRFGSFGGAVGYFLLALAFTLALSAGTAAIGLRAKSAESVASLLQLPYLPLLLLSSVFVPVTAFPGWLQTVIRVSPVTALADSLRALATGGPHAGGGPTTTGGTGQLWYAAVWIVAMAALFGVAATRAFRRAT